MRTGAEKRPMAENRLEHPRCSRRRWAGTVELNAADVE
jgi:hypothetical protein